jgi:hypothetical protein
VRESSVGPDRRKRNDGRRRQSSLRRPASHAAGPEERSERENRGEGVSLNIENIFLIMHDLNMKETWESG